eukprot:g1979.t1
MIVGKEFNVTYSVHNVGSIAALDVEVSDFSWPKDLFEYVAGKPGFATENLDPGERFSYVFTLKPLHPSNSFLSERATLEYSWLEPGEEEDMILSTESKTSAAGRFTIYLESDYAKMYSGNIVEWCSFVFVEIVCIVIPYVAYKVAEVSRI